MRKVSYCIRFINIGAYLLINFTKYKTKYKYYNLIVWLFISCLLLAIKQFSFFSFSQSEETSNREFLGGKTYNTKIW